MSKSPTPFDLLPKLTRVSRKTVVIHYFHTEKYKRKLKEETTEEQFVAVDLIKDHVTELIKLSQVLRK